MTQFKVSFNAEALASVKEYLFKRGITPDRLSVAAPWTGPTPQPFPGLTRVYRIRCRHILRPRHRHFARSRQAADACAATRRPRVMVIQAASGAGKSSYLRAGVSGHGLNAMPDFFPGRDICGRRKVSSPGLTASGRKLAALLSQPARPLNPGDIHAQLMAANQTVAAAAFAKLMSETAALGLDQRRIGDSGAKTPALVLAIDQAEELFASEDQAESERFLFLLAQLLSDPPQGVEPFAIFTIRADRASPLFEAITERKLEFPETLPLLPLPQTAYREVILKPLDVIARRGQTLVDQMPHWRIAWSKMPREPMLCRCSPLRFHTFTRNSASPEKLHSSNTRPPGESPVRSRWL